jgi:N6-adenosine-specific RNA methylase IME4
MGKAKISFNMTPVVRAMGKVSEIQVYQRMYFDNCVKPKTDVEIEEKGIDRDHKLSYINMRTAEIYEGEAAEICDIVCTEYEALEKE